MEGYDWTIVRSVAGKYIPESFVRKIPALSQHLNESVVDISTTSTGDFACYWHYRSGHLIGKLEKLYERARGYEDRKLDSDLFDFLFANDPNCELDTYFHFLDLVHGIDEVIPINQRNWSQNSYAFTRRFMERQKIYLPNPCELSYSTAKDEEIIIHLDSAVDIDQLALIDLDLNP
ncbi:MAG: hypothetical protein AAGA46_08685 [Cyanobacteria bacterium P01_F01_bin.13]